ncbi:hypothetical protein BACCOP_00416 [Phocaeicola coprocola DSM 17136]|uniref:Uncharacterized protein n=1 Tax=Phocaeicola coprocola DSM 17136 TaxID=470145 RepID=B3JEX2_9BACT|nr:hypothetical protein BACCOP_00416 [Phocaeicola coprocola DSM 17136]
MLKLNYFLADIFILSAEKQPIKLSWRKIEWLQNYKNHLFFTKCPSCSKSYNTTGFSELQAICILFFYTILLKRLKINHYLCTRFQIGI